MPQPNHKTQVAIYARVSTRDKQDVQNQLRELRQWTKKMGYKIYHEYVDNESGAKGRTVQNLILIILVVMLLISCF